MHAFPTLVSLALLLAARLVDAGVYVTNPVQATTCTGGQSCLVQWVDDGQAPLLSSIGECQVALYTGSLQLVQSLPSVDVSTTSSFTFTPNPIVGANGAYYLVFTASDINYQSFSGSFTLSGMSGTTPSGGSSTPATTPATTPTGSSASVGSSVSGTPTGTVTGTGTGTTPSGTSTPTVSTTGSTTAAETSTGTTPSATPTETTPSTSSGSTTSGTVSTISSSSSSSSASASASATNAAVRVGSSTSVGGMAALFALAGMLAF